MRIAISGKQGAGKSELSKIFIDKYGFEYVSFAKALKEMAIEEYGLSEEEVYGAKKKREFLQNLGAEKRDEDINYWVKIVIDSLEEDKNYVLDDLRYLNEFDALKDNGFVMVRVLASEEVRKDRIGSTFGNPTHKSETDLDSVENNPTLYKDREENKRYWDVFINNETIDIERFRGCADSIYKSFTDEDKV